MVYKEPKISFVRQALSLKKNYPGSKCIQQGNDLIWYGEIRPTPLSRTYNIRIECHGLHNNPRVILYGDNIEGIERPDFPHHFEINKTKSEVELCLYMCNEFNYRCWIADTIIPWAQEWLYFYEIWLATGKWCGGGHVPGNPRISLSKE